MILFISDLHLSELRPKNTELFYAFLNEHASKSQGLYILGDFFEVWLGLDAATPHDLQICHALKALSPKVPIYFISGNRDFLINETFAGLCGLKLLQEPHSMDAGQLKLILMHGDALCTQDRSYQVFRRIVRLQWLQNIFLRLPVHWRRNIAQKIRVKSAAKYKNPATRHQLDADPHAITWMIKQKKASHLIHGHTHIALREKLEPEGERIVLAEWSEHQGSYLELNDDKLTLRTYHHP